MPNETKSEEESKIPLFSLDAKSVKDLALSEMIPSAFTNLLERLVQSKHLSGQLAWEYDRLFLGFRAQEMERREKAQAQESERIKKAQAQDRQIREIALEKYGSEWIK